MKKRGFSGPHSEATKKILSMKNKGKRFSPATEFRAGHIPWNKGLKRIRVSRPTEFKRGHRPANWKPVGTIVIRPESNGTLTRRIKVADPNKWEQYARYLWKKTKGRGIPPGFIIYHLDGNSLNDAPENLICIPRSIHIKWLKADLEGFEAKRIKNTSMAQKKRWQKKKIAAPAPILPFREI